jgi:hypothetical protein
MTSHSRTIIVAVIVAIIAFFIGYAVGPKIAEAPSMSNADANVLASAPAGAGIIHISIVTLKEDASTSPSVSIEYPQFPSLPADFNSAIATSVTSRLADFRQAAAETETARNATANNLPGQPGASIPASDYSFIATWQETQISDKYVSFIVRFDSYTGGANGNDELQTFNYDIAAKKIVSLSDIFPKRADYLTAVADIARSQLTESLNSASNGNAPLDMISAGTEPTADNFANFTFTDDMVTVYFPKYAVAPGSFGEQHVDIPRSAVE